MKIIQATFYINDDKRADFLADIFPLITSARLEEGCLKYDLYESVEKKTNLPRLRIGKIKKRLNSITKIRY